MRSILAVVSTSIFLSSCTPAAPKLVLDCTAPFTKDASAASLTAHFGAANVTDETVPGPEGSELRATVVFAKDPKRRIEVHFFDEAGRTGLLNARVSEITTQWTGPGGIRMGAGIDAIEKVNGKPFLLTGFDWDMSGYTTDWRGGTFSNRSSGCKVGVRLSPTAASYGQDILGEGPYGSELPSMRAAAPKVVEFSVGYGFETPQ